MSIQVITGVSSKVQEDFLIAQARDFLAEKSQNKVFYLVPNFAKFESEVAGIRKLANLVEKSSETVATMRFQVFSFERLAWYLLGEGSFLRKEAITQTGLSMILRKVLQEEASALSLFKGEVSKPGFIAQLLDCFHEFQQGNITTEELKDFLEREKENIAIQHKFQDILTLFERLLEKLAIYNVETKSSVELLSEQMHAIDLRDTMILIHGYSRFSAVELVLVEELMKHARAFKIAIVTDSVRSSDKILALDLFENGKHLYQTLLGIARKNQLRVLTDAHLESVDERERTLSQTFLALHRGEKRASPAPTGLSFHRCSTPIVEIERVARKIRQLVSEEKVRYKDIHVLTRDFEWTSSVLPSVFRMHEIPYTMDKSSEMKHHGLVEFLQSLFDSKRYFYRNNDVLRLLRSELFVPFYTSSFTKGEQTQLSLFDEGAETFLTYENWLTKMQEFREQVDICENVVLQFGYDQKDWLNGREWVFVDFDYLGEDKENVAEINRQNCANEVRRFVTHSLKRWNSLFEKVQTAREGAIAFYQFLEEMGVEKQFLHLRNHAETLEKKRNYEQIWGTFVEVLEEYVRIFDESPFVFQEFAEILEAGLINESFGKIPATLDVVQVKNMELATNKQAKIVFVIGLNQQTLPLAYENKSILTLEERDLFRAHLPEGKFFFNDIRIRSNNENFLAYHLLLSASNQLFISFAENVEGEKECKLSPLFEKVRLAFGLEMLSHNEALSSLDVEEMGEYVSTKRALISDLMKVRAESTEKKVPLHALWTTLAHSLRQTEYKALLSKLEASFSYENVPTNLESTLTDTLYGTSIEASVSRFECYNECAYKHFAHYGLHLRKREILQMDAASTGNYFHEALDVFFKTLHAHFNGKHLALLTAEERQFLTAQMFQEISGNRKFSLLKKDARMRYMHTQLNAVVEKVLWTLFEQARRTPLVTKETELVFGHLTGGNMLPAPSFDLGNGRSVSLRGKIDRLDHFVDKQGQEFLTIVDYKSGQKEFDLVESYYGLSMQMLTYLDVVLQNNPNAQALGAYYLHLQNPTLAYTEQVAENPQEELLKAMKMKGLTIVQPQGLQEMDRTLEKGNSLVFPIKRTEKSGLQPSSVNASFYEGQEEFSRIRKNNADNFQTAAKELFEGKLPLNPLREGNKPRSCAFCSFKSLCQFDPMLKENHYTEMIKFSGGNNNKKKQEVLKVMEAGLNPRVDKKEKFDEILKEMRGV